ncbi:MAG: T9SS type A sorting domain-containing protein [Bacteroidales bacterium]|jgi:hypothetical protein|nr:T9SS type A sorting domain-containing protein [Bacteroidales bacterium]
MKKILYFLAFMGMTSLLFAQSVTLTYNGDPLNANDTIFVPVGRLNTEYVAGFVMHNTTSDTINLRAAKEAIDLVSGATVSICMMICADPEVDTTDSENVFPLGGGATSPADVFTLHYSPNGHSGNSLIRVTLFNATDMSDNVIFYVIFGTEVSIATTKTTANNNIAAYPNPATDKVTIKYSLSKDMPARLVLKNLMGQTLYTAPLSAGSDKVSIDVSQYASGIYFYSLLIGERVVSTKKLLVR